MVPALSRRVPPGEAGLRATHARRSARDRVLSTLDGSTQARRACRVMPQHVVEFADVVRVRNRPLGGSQPRPPTPGSLHRKVQTMWRAVHLQRRAPASAPPPRRPPPSRDRVVQVRKDHPPDWVTRRCSTWGTLSRVQRPARQLGLRLPPRDVDRGDDNVEAGEEVVGEVERSVGPDLDSQPWRRRKPSGGVSGGAVPSRSSCSKRLLSAAMISCCCC